MTKKQDPAQDPVRPSTPPTSLHQISLYFKVSLHLFTRAEETVLNPGANRQV